MKNKQIIYTLILLAVCVFGATNTAHALEITEIMYDISGSDSDREWVEVHNSTPLDLMLEEFKLFENGVGHTVAAVEGYSGVLQNKSYAIIADNPSSFLSDNPTYEGLLYKSSFSLSNTGEEIGIVDSAGQIIHNAVYSKDLGAKGNGLSLQYFEGVFIEGSPTPGLDNVKEVFIESDKDDPEDVVSDISSHEHQVHLSTASLERIVYVDIGRERSAREGELVKFEATSSGKGSLRRITYIWNFGDGTTKKGRKVEHVYSHAGTYNVVVNAIMGTSRAVARTKVYVRDASIVATANMTGITLSNTDIVETNIGSYYLKDKKEIFTFPKDTIIDASSSNLFTWDVLRFDWEDIKSGGSELYSPDKKKIRIVIE